MRVGDPRAAGHLPSPSALIDLESEYRCPRGDWSADLIGLLIPLAVPEGVRRRERLGRHARAGGWGQKMRQRSFADRSAPALRVITDGETRCAADDMMQLASSSFTFVRACVRVRICVEYVCVCGRRPLRNRSGEA